MNKPGYAKLRELADNGVSSVDAICAETGWSPSVALRYVHNRRYRKGVFS